MNTKLQKAADVYCKVRISSNIVIFILLAISALYATYNIKKSVFIKTTGLITSINTEFQEKENVHYPIYTISFTDNLSKINFKTNIKDTKKQLSNNEVNDFVNQRKNTPITIFYNTIDPMGNIQLYTPEKSFTSILLSLAFLLLFFAFISYALIDNSIFCGFVIFRDIFSLFTL